MGAWAPFVGWVLVGCFVVFRLCLLCFSCSEEIGLPRVGVGSLGGRDGGNMVLVELGCGWGCLGGVWSAWCFEQPVCPRSVQARAPRAARVGDFIRERRPGPLV